MNNNEKIEILELYDFNDKNKIDSSNNNDDDNKNSKIKIWYNIFVIYMGLLLVSTKALRA